MGGEEGRKRRGIQGRGKGGGEKGEGRDKFKGRFPEPLRGGERGRTSRADFRPPSREERREEGGEERGGKGGGETGEGEL